MKLGLISFEYRPNRGFEVLKVSALAARSKM